MKFYHVINNKRNSGITIVANIVKPPSAWRFPVEATTFSVECAVSYCAPVELSFSRPKGRMIAQSRLSSQKQLPLFKRFSFLTVNQQGLKAQILSCLNQTLDIGWAKSLVNKELKRLNMVQHNRALDQRVSTEQRILDEEIPF